MDENKRLKLVDIGYEIRPVCITCVYGRFSPNSHFGDCVRWKYDHLKHSDSHRDLSVYRAGSCGEHELNPGTEAALHGFKEFVK